MKKVKAQIMAWIGAWDQFWFKPVEALPLACFRFCFCSVLLIMYSFRFFDIRVFFYESGLLSSASARALFKLDTTYLFHLILASDAWLYMAHLALLVILCAMALGIASRWLAIAAFVLHLMFMHRNPTIVYGVDNTATVWLFYLIFAQAGGRCNGYRILSANGKRAL